MATTHIELFGLVHSLASCADDIELDDYPDKCCAYNDTWGYCYFAQTLQWCDDAHSSSRLGDDFGMPLYVPAECKG